jgi:hypothetical protein
MNALVVAQVFNLPYRRISFCDVSEIPERSAWRPLCRLKIGDTADWKSALP